MRKRLILGCCALDARGRAGFLVFFSHSHAANAGYFGYGEFVGKSGDVSKQYREKQE